MKKRIFALVLCLAALGGAVAYAAAGDGDDPLISLSYITNNFLPAVKNALTGIAEDTAAAYKAEHPAVPADKTLTLKQGESAELTSGQQFILLDGAAQITVASGTLVNATAGTVTGNGAAQRWCRYIVCEESRAFVDAAGEALLEVSCGAAVTASCPFTDVQRSDWFYTDVVSAYGRGLVNGMTAETYAPYDTLTAAQAVKLAACMHQLYHTGAVALEPGGEMWYRSYVDYALENGIAAAEFADYDAVITRADFVKLFFNALPEREYTRLNTIMDGAIPDVPTDAEIAREVYTFYAAGILMGYTASETYQAHAFGPDTTISRAEVAAIMNRMFDSGARQRFSIG